MGIYFTREHTKTTFSLISSTNSLKRTRFQRFFTLFGLEGLLRVFIFVGWFNYYRAWGMDAILGTWVRADEALT